MIKFESDEAELKTQHQISLGGNKSLPLSLHRMSQASQKNFDRGEDEDGEFV